MQQPNPLFPFETPLLLFNVGGNLSTEGIPRPLFLPTFFLLQGGGMDLSKVGEKILSSVRSARSIGLLPPATDRPEVPARAAAAAAVARALASLPPHQRYNLSSSSEELSSIYGSKVSGEVVEELEEEFYEEEFDPVRHILEHIPSEENELLYFEKQASLRLAQLDKVAERLSKHVMNHHEVMVKGMHLVREVEKDLKVANVICMNGRRYLNASRNEVSRDLIVNKYSKKKQAFQDMLPILNELRHALAMQTALENLVDEGNYCKAFQVLSEYLQLLDTFSQLSAIQEMSRGVEVWLAKTLQKLDSLLMGVCQKFEVEAYITVVDAYALIGDVSGLAEKIQSFFMQEILSESHSILKCIVEEDWGQQLQSSRYTYSDLCGQIPESKFRVCLLRTLAAMYKLMCSYFAIMSFQPENEIKPASGNSLSLQEMPKDDSVTHSGEIPLSNNGFITESEPAAFSTGFKEETSANETAQSSHIRASNSARVDSRDTASEVSDNVATSSSGSPWYQLRKDAAAFVSQTLQRGRKNLWQLTTSRLSVLLSSSAVCSTSIHQFLKNYEDLNVFILAGEAFCGHEVSEFRQKLKNVCENYYAGFHRQNVYALKMVLDKETWMRLPPETIQVISFAGLVGDGAPIIIPTYGSSTKAVEVRHSNKSADSLKTGAKNNGFAYWLESGNPFLPKASPGFKESGSHNHNGTTSLESAGKAHDVLSGNSSPTGSNENSKDVAGSADDDENEDLHADFIDEDSQLPSRVVKPRARSAQSNNEDTTAQTGSSLCLLRLMDKYARLMHKLEVTNVEFFKGICQLFGIFFHTVYETFVAQSNSTGKGVTDYVNYRLKTALSRINQDCDQWIRPQLLSSSAAPLNSTFGTMDITPVSPPSTSIMSSTSFGLKERCAAADSLSQVAQTLHRAKPHLQSVLLQNNATVVEDFYMQVVNSVPDLTEHIHRATARLLLHINGYADRIASAKWELKELGLEHNGYVDLLLGEFKHYKTRLVHGGINKETQDLLLKYGLEIVAEILVEGLSRIKRCTDEGRALMSLDLQVLINGLQHFAPANVRPKFLIVEAFIKAYYLPETEFVHWARAHPEYTKNQVVGLINLVATMKGWKRKTRLDILEKIE